MTSLEKICLTLVVVLGISSCTPPKYFTEKTSDIAAEDLDHSVTDFIPLPDEDLDSSRILAASYDLIIQGKYAKLEKYLSALEKKGGHSSDLYLSEAILYITKKDYSSALPCLQKINNQEYPLLKRLLTIDTSYELAKENGIPDFNKFLKEYQDLVDSYPDDYDLKKIVTIRLRYLRYNY